MLSSTLPVDAFTCGWPMPRRFRRTKCQSSRIADRLFELGEARVDREMRAVVSGGTKEESACLRTRQRARTSSTRYRGPGPNCNRASRRADGRELHRASARERAVYAAANDCRDRHATESEVCRRFAACEPGVGHDRLASSSRSTAITSELAGAARRACHMGDSKRAAEPVDSRQVDDSHATCTTAQS
jgi:hypothetical protein